MFNIYREEALRENAYLNIDTDELFDSNCITPGTKFMHSMDIRLKEYIKDRSENDPAWRKLVSQRVCFTLPL